MLSLARELASRHGYTVLQAIQEWHRLKGSSNGLPLGEVSADDSGFNTSISDSGGIVVSRLKEAA